MQADQESSEEQETTIAPKAAGLFDGIRDRHLVQLGVPQELEDFYLTFSSISTQPLPTSFP
jgi:hypothetical protein